MADRDDSEYGDESWVPDEALKGLALEAEVHSDESNAERAKRLLTENADVAAASLIHIAKHDPNARLRLDAGKYILERVLGKAGDDPAEGALETLFAGLDRLKANAAAMDQSSPHSDLS